MAVTIDMVRRKWLFPRSMLVSIVTPFEPDTFSTLLRLAIFERWTDKVWPVVHFFPEAPHTGGEAAYRHLLRPGSCCLASPSFSPWACERFRALHHDTGALPITVVGGELDRSVLATVIGSAERDVPVTMVSASSVCRDRHGATPDAAREFVISILRGFALDATVAELLAGTRLQPK